MSQQPAGYRYTFKGVGMTCAGIWFLLAGLMALIPGVAVPQIIMAILALGAGAGILIGF